MHSRKLGRKSRNFVDGKRLDIATADTESDEIVFITIPYNHSRTNRTIQTVLYYTMGIIQESHWKGNCKATGKATGKATVKRLEKQLESDWKGNWKCNWKGNWKKQLKT